MATVTIEKKRKATSSETAASKKARTSKSSTAESKIQDAQAQAGVAPAETNTSAVDEIIFDPEPDNHEDSASEDDQTAALLKGFEDPSSDEEESALTPFDAATLPDPSNAITKSSSSKALAKNASADSNAPTVLYLSRVPHGFFEPEMRSYFSQFGTIKHLRLARNRRTGASKHYAFLEFTDPEIASIVQKTMDNYLMFKHILKVKLVPREKVHEALWKGADRRFRKVPWNRIERTRVASTDREGWGKRVKNEEKRRIEKAEKLKKLGYQFEVPRLRDVATVPVHVVEQAQKVEEIEAAGAKGKRYAAEAIAAIREPGKIREPGYAAAAAEESDTVKVKKSKRKAIAASEDVVETVADRKKSDAQANALKKKKTSKSGVKVAEAGKQITAV